MWGLNEDDIETPAYVGNLQKHAKARYPAILIYELCSKPVLQVVALLCLWGASYKNFILLPFLLEWQFVVSIILSRIHHMPAPGWYMGDTSLIILPYGKLLYSRPSHFNSGLATFLVSYSILYPLPYVIVPLMALFGVASLSNIYLGFSHILDSVYGWAVGGVLGALVYGTDLRSAVLLLAPWAQFVAMSSSIPILLGLSLLVNWMVPAAAAKDTDFWVSVVKKSHPSPNTELVIDDRRVDVLLPSIAYILGLSIGMASVAEIGKTSSAGAIVGVGLAVYIPLSVMALVAMSRSVRWALPVVQFLLGLWAPLATATF